MKKSEILLKVCAVLLTICFVLTSATAVQIVKVFAEEGQNETFEQESTDFVVDPDPDQNPDPNPDLNPDPNPDSDPDPDPVQPDPFDYNLACYTPSINFGKVNQGDVVYARQFAIVNIGTTTFPLTWEEVDPYTAFDVGSISPTNVMEPQDSILFSVSPNEGLNPGTYT
ncbi:MAG: hypothetical protein ILA11_02135, partial [Butyrivibrio sp.]|nr:hypothetical protein [Butyrivibrio sp.]